MEAEAIIEQQGNGVGLLLPVAILRATGLHVGQTVSLQSTSGGLLIKPPRKRYTAAELNAMCDPGAPMPADLEAWDAMPDVGLEAA
jgi:antitoxin component of MazEF toxin-antitoxin module